MIEAISPLSRVAATMLPSCCSSMVCEPSCGSCTRNTGPLSVLPGCKHAVATVLRPCCSCADFGG